jgi:RHS repeat-associated protein
MNRWAAGAAVPTDAGSTAPKAYLQYILFNKNMSMAQHGHHMVSEEAGSSWQHLQLRVPIEEIGYIYIYVINESMDGVDVYFDDLEVQLIDAPLTSASDYYPYGLPIGYRSHSSGYYRYGYQGQFAEKDEETGWNAFELRMYEPVIGRWMSTDPAGQFASPYVGMGNNPINGVDTDGGWADQGVTSNGDVVFDNENNNGNVYLVNDDFLGKIGDLQTLIANSTQIVDNFNWIGSNDQMIDFVKSQFKFAGLDVGSFDAFQTISGGGFRISGALYLAGGKVYVRPEGTWDFNIKTGSNQWGNVYDVRNNLEHEFVHVNQFRDIISVGGVSVSNMIKFVGKLEMDAVIGQILSDNFLKSSGANRRNAARYYYINEYAFKTGKKAGSEFNPFFYKLRLGPYQNIPK